MLVKGAPVEFFQAQLISLSIGIMDSSSVLPSSSWLTASA